ncbi:gluconokinase [Streptomyces turgidiscabies]|uniref:Putative gluconokinase n=1 Tax=Streptomyces turgidiscabies (strain Car8) TaxID=698760 RepID=L7FBH3_STRT8|nr:MULTISPECIES: gluconokinase [Streptomyces]ELP68010.1 putative gluconokinase [Streptomyces turgidiscabies Car8]MDX3499909.1 gluconokinase [Streptomyces turgidiscabies]GAQ76948.1 xylulose kinase [Streptomyces turgidiscabies]
MKDEAQVVLGIDLGTTATKVVAVDGAYRVVSTVERPAPLRTGRHGEAVHDPETVLAGAVEAVRESVGICAGRGLSVVALSFSAALHTLLALDSSGEPLTPALSWADTRAAGIARHLRAPGSSHGTGIGRAVRDSGRAAASIECADADALHRATGTPVHSMAPLTKLAWFTAHEPELMRRTATWCGLKDYVLSRFTGRLVTDLSCASATGLLDMRTTRWHGPALDIAGVSADRLPELVPPTAVFTLLPEAAAVLGLPAGLPVVAGAGDGPLANLAVGATAPATAALSLGTSGALRVVRDRPGVDERCRVFCYYLADGLWVLGGAVSNAGVVAQWAAESFGGVDVGDLLKEAAQVEPGAEGLIALPHLLGERAPWWDPDARGALIGLRRGHGRAHMTRAMIEGVGQQLALVRDSLLAADAPVTSVRATGGALRSPLWAEIVAAALDMPLEITDDAAGSGFGAALLARHALGDLPSLTSPVSGARAHRTVIPDQAAARRLAETRGLGEQLYQLLRGVQEPHR